MSEQADRVRRVFHDVERRERTLLAAAMLSALAVTIFYTLISSSAPLEGDQPDYHEYGRQFTAGHWWWTSAYFETPHASALKPPIYPLWVGLGYWLFGPHDLAVELMQSLLAPLTVLISWLLARRLFGPRVAIVSAFAVALFPLAFEFYGRLYPEALALPLVMGTIALFLAKQPSNRLAIAAGALLGLNLLLRPTSGFLAAGMLAAWVIAAGWRRGIGYTALAGIVALLVIAPWSVRNAVVLDAFIPISIQDAAVYGTFNETAAEDPLYPYAWRPLTPEAEPLLVDRDEPLPEPELHDRLQELGLDYIGEHPESVPLAIYWNGLRRYWDLRSPGQAIDEARIQGRSTKFAAAGLAAYYVIGPLALWALWRLRRRPEIVWPLLAMGAASAVIFSVAAFTRYRAPIEPLLAILAAYAALDILDRFVARRQRSPTAEGS